MTFPDGMLRWTDIRLDDVQIVYPSTWGTGIGLLEGALSLNIREWIALGETETFKVQDAKRNALQVFTDEARKRLWDKAVSQVNLKHPDHRVDVRPWVAGGHRTTIHIALHGLRDTKDPSKVIMLDGGTKPFQTQFGTHEWPGMEAAKLTIVGCFMAYLIHETLELVTDRTKDSRDYGEVADWHPHHGAHSTTVNRIIDHTYWGCGTEGLIEMAGSYLGERLARGIFDKNKVPAQLELEREIEHVLDWDVEE